jgi:hypothetical protein
LLGNTSAPTSADQQAVCWRDWPGKIDGLPDNPEDRRAAQIAEAKDCAVQALLYEPGEPDWTDIRPLSEASR